MTRRLTTRAALARHAGVSRPAITKACKGPLSAACDGDRVDLDHPLIREYLRAKGRELSPAPEAPAPAVVTDAAPPRPAKTARRRAAVPTAAPAAPVKKASAAPPAPTPPAPSPEDEGDGEGEPGDIPEVAGATPEEVDKLRRALRPILARHGTRRGFTEWLKAVDTLEAIRKKRLDNEETEGRLISRELVRTRVLGAIEGSNRMLLGDAPKTIARLLYAMANSKEPLEAGEERVREVISTILKSLKSLDHTLE